MNKYIALCLCVSLCVVLCEYLNAKEGDECEWEGLKGTCVKETRCLTTLDDDSPKHPVCSNYLGEKIICCTDCNLVNSTKNALFIPPSGLLWKNGQKARDNCLQYLQDLPYKCKEDGFYAGINRELDEDNRCYGYGEWDADSSSSEFKKPTAQFPHQVLLGFAHKLLYVHWESEGFIISDKYIVTAASTNWGKLQYVAVGVSNRWDRISWQNHPIKRFIVHPEFNGSNQFYNDIALIETKTPIKFNEEVLPACLHVEEDASIEEAITTLKESCYEDGLFFDYGTMHTAKLREFSEDKCNATFNNVVSFDHETQICYGSEIVEMDLASQHTHRNCTVVKTNPLMITTQFSSCVHTAIGLSIPFGGCEVGFCQIFTRVSHYVPWIESIVWPDEA